jgi:hypothetical protein
MMTGRNACPTIDDETEMTKDGGSTERPKAAGSAGEQVSR